MEKKFALNKTSNWLTDDGFGGQERCIHAISGAGLDVDFNRSILDDI